VLVPAWLLEKLIGRDRGVAGEGFAFGRPAAHVVSRASLLEFARREELPLEQTPPDCETLLLMARPEPDVLSSTPGPELLLRYWRMTFGARARAAVRGALAGEADPRAAVQRRIERLGRTAYHEARFVLVRDKYLAHWADDLDSFAQFAALFLEFAFFAPEDVAVYFPLIQSVVSAAAAAGEGINPEEVLKATKPPGAADREARGAADGGAAVTPAGGLKRRASRDVKNIEGLLRRARESDAVGNDVRAAIYRMRAYRASGTATGGTSRDSRTTVYAEALRDLDQLVARLKAALGLEDSVARQWRAWLAALLDNAAGGWWNAEGRLLYDLQKVCVYHEREIYSANVVDWVLDVGRRPLKRPQPGQRLVLMVKSLRSALRRAGRVRLSAQGRAELIKLTDGAIALAEARLREFLRPRVEEALVEGGLEPGTAAERVARDKLVEELLDEAVAYGYLTFGALRDAVSRNQMKLNDLSDARDFVQGDQLLRIDRRMEDRLDYVYHRGEIYLRLFHRLSSLFFATDAGRFLTKWLILPFGGAFLILEALDHSVGKLIRHAISRRESVRGLAASAASNITSNLAPTNTEVAKQASEAHAAVFNHWWVLVMLGLFLLGVINVPAFRRAAGRVFGRVWGGLRLAIVDLPRWVATRPVVRRLFGSLGMRLFGRYVLKPLVLVGLAFLFIPPDASVAAHVLTLAVVFFATNLALNSRAGRALEQSVLHAIRTTVARFGWEILVSIFRGIMNLFEAMLEAIDRVLYAVDEMLRFRAGQGRSAVAAKMVLGVLWFYIAYVTRFVINLLVEPQINPIKHFPVVTVSHKLLIPTIPFVGRLLKTVGVPQPNWTAGVIITSIPGIFGFLAWEFKENWKLYKANRGKSVRPVRVGSHGETIASFLRPGFHSGTIPKIFGRLRKAKRRAGLGRAALRPGATARHLHALEHVRHAIEAFVGREFVALLNRQAAFSESPVVLRGVRLATTTILIDLAMKSAPGGNGSDGAAAGDGGVMTIRLEQRALWIVAGIDAGGFLPNLSAARRELFAAGLLGLYKMAGVDLVEEQVRARLAPGDVRFDLRKNLLVVWPVEDFSVETAYDLSAPEALVARGVSPRDGAFALPPLRRELVLLGMTPLPREAWTRLWDGSASRTAGLPRVEVLPPVREREGGVEGTAGSEPRLAAVTP
jgi:hypothetical protein